MKGNKGEKNPIARFKLPDHRNYQQRRRILPTIPSNMFSKHLAETASYNKL